jgi:hypothetical protein
VNDLLSVLQEFYRDKLAMLSRREAAARHITQYDVNNTYQYIINRDEVQLSWLESAIARLGGTVPAAEPPPPMPGSGPEAARQAMEEDARAAQAFVDRWRPRVESLRNARDAKLLQLVLGEVLEQKRFVEQGLAGRTDLLGRRAAQTGPAIGEVMPTRWIE